MKKNKLKRISPALKSIYPILILIVCFIMGIGYATLNTVSLQITGQGVALLQKGVFITDVSYSTSKGIDILQSNINATSGTVLNSSISLSPTDSTSYVTYTITILNNYNYKVYFNGTSYSNDFYDNENIIFELSDNLVEGMMLDPHTYITFDITFKYKSGVSPNQNNCILNSYINFNFPSVAVLQATSYSDSTKFRSETYKQKIKNITFQNKINIPSNAVESWDIGVSQTGDVMAYVVNNATAGYYDLYIQSNSQLYANTDMSYWFYEMKLVDSINGLNLLETSETTDMYSMFRGLGYSSTVFSLGTLNFDTSKVTDMSYMFFVAGFNSTKFELDVTSFDTSNVVDMTYMFGSVGRENPNFATLDISNLDTSKVTSMAFMFSQVGMSSTTFTLDVSKLDTSNVTNMSSMFRSAGMYSKVFTLDVTGFDTSNVKNMENMFDHAGYSSDVFSLDVSGFDTSQVTDMSNMFEGTGRNNKSFQLDISNFDTSNVTDFSYMFYKLGELSTTFTLDVSGFDTSKATDMSGMFYYTGHQSKVLHLDVSNFDTSKVTNMNSMFKWAGHENPNFTLDVSNFDTSNVTDMAEMFRANGIRNPNFTLDVSNFDTSNVTDMKWMFYFVGNLSTKLVLDLGNWDTSKVTNMDSMFHSAGVKTIYASNKWNTSNVTTAVNIFTSCNYLVGGMGTAYTSSYGDIAYAKIDGGSSSPGYFTSRPDGYRMLNYIESTGTQYIDTGVSYSVNNSYLTELQVVYNTTEPNNQIMGFNGHRGMGVGTYLASFWECEPEPMEAGVFYDLTWYKNGTEYSRSVNGIVYGGSDGNYIEWWTGNLLLFAAAADSTNSTVTYYSYAKYYAVKIYVNDVLVRDFVPCKNSFGEAGMYDLLSGTFYGNVGTGKFNTG